MSTNTATILLGLFAFQVASAAPQQPNPVDGIQDRFETTGPMASAIAILARKIQMPIGLVEDSWQTQPCIVDTIIVNPLQPEDALDAIMSQCPAYVWKKVGSRTVILPKRTVQSALEISVRTIRVKEAIPEQAQAYVMALPEIQQWLHSNGILPFDLESPNPHWKSETRISVELSGIKLVDILDAIARASGRMSWRVVWFDHDKYMGIYF